MPTPPIPPERIEAFHRAYSAAVAAGCVPLGQPVGTGRTSALTRAAAEMGLSAHQAKDCLARLTSAGAIRRTPLLPPAPPPAPDGFVVSSHSAQTDAAGNVEREWTKSKPAPGPAFEPPPGHMVKGVSALVDAEGRTLAQWIKTRETAAPVLLEALREAFAAFDGIIPPSPAPDATDGDLLTLYPVPDLHVGMYAWGQETGADYDIRIASDIARSSMARLVSQSQPSGLAVILVLGDYFHADDQRNATPASLHALDVDGRRPKVYRAGVELLMALIETAKAKHAHVRLVVVPGNHDPDSAITLTVDQISQ